MRGVGVAGVHVALDDVDVRVASGVERLLARPERLPARVVHFTAKAGGFRLLVEAQTGDGLQVALQGDEAVERGPEAVAAHGQDDGFELPAFFHGVDGDVALAPVDGGDVLLGGEVARKGVILQRLDGVVGGGVLVVAEARFVQIDDARLNALLEQALHVGSRGVFGRFGGDAQDAALLVELAVDELRGFEAERRARHHERARQAHQKRHAQRVQHGFLVRVRHGEPSSA